MASTPFDSLPKKKFAGRILAPTLVVFFFSFVLVMLVFTPDNSSFKQKRDPSAIIVETDPQANMSPVTKAFSKITSVPPKCFIGHFDNNFQMAQCNQYWRNFAEAAFYTLLPLVLAFLFYIVAFDLMRTLYRNARMKISTGEAITGAVVTNPPLAPMDFLGWMFCLLAVGAQRTDGKQMRVYMAYGSQVPKPGDRLAIFYVGHFFGKKRYVAIPYTPHVAIFAGVR